MSTLMYGAFTTKSKSNPSVLNKYAVSLAALVPAEVLAAHAAILSFTTKAVDPSDASRGSQISSPTVLGWSFWGFAGIALLIYVTQRLKTWDPKRDYIRMFIPPLAFVGWTMIQRTTAFDAVWPSLSLPARDATGLFAAILLGILATGLAYKVTAPA